MRHLLVLGTLVLGACAPLPPEQLQAVRQQHDARLACETVATGAAGITLQDYTDYRSRSRPSQWAQAVRFESAYSDCMVRAGFTPERPGIP